MAKTLANLSDAELSLVAHQAVTAMTGAAPSYGTIPADVLVVSGAVDEFDDSISSQTSAQATAKACTAAKEAKREIVINYLRTHRDLAKAHGADDILMANLGLPAGGDPVPPSATIPVGAVDTSRRLEHTLDWFEQTTPDNKKRPRGVMGADIFCKIDGPPPGDVSECNFVTTDSATPYTVHYTMGEAGKMAHYMLRWRMRDGSAGSWGETVSATITG